MIGTKRETIIMSEAEIKELFSLIQGLAFMGAAFFYATMINVRLARLSAIGFIIFTSALMALDGGVMYGLSGFILFVLTPIIASPIIYLLMVFVKWGIEKSRGETGITLSFDWLGAYKAL